MGVATEGVRGRFPLGGGNDEERGAGMTGDGVVRREVRRGSDGFGGGCNGGTAHVEIPAASAGMTEMGGLGGL